VRASSSFHALRAVALAALLAGLQLSAHAGLFDDDEARKAILDLRAKVTDLETKQADLITQNGQLTEQVQQLQRSLLDANNQLDALRGDLAKLRGQDEQLARDVADLQRRQKDISQGVDDRLRKLEPQQVTVDGKTFTADPDERKAYEDAVAPLRNGDFAASATSIAAFIKHYPSSGYLDSARFWLGNADYGKRDYKDAIANFRAFINGAPDHPRAPEALLAIANCQVEMRDNKAARRTLGELLKQYPKSEAAEAARDRLASLK
jgi:tol-pal system protein YbgF